MQYHLNGFCSGDPSIALAGPDAGTVCDDVDVLIVGCGPAELTLDTQLAAFPEITAMLTDLKSGPLEVGQADGLACRSVEMFESFGFAAKVLKEAYWDQANPVFTVVIQMDESLRACDFCYLELSSKFNRIRCILTQLKMVWAKACHVVSICQTCECTSGRGRLTVCKCDDFF